MIFHALDVTDEHFELMFGFLALGVVGILRGGIGTPKRIGQAEIHPAQVSGGQFQRLRFGVNVMRPGKRAVGKIFFRLGLELRIVIGGLGGGGGDGQFAISQQEQERENFHR